MQERDRYGLVMLTVTDDRPTDDRVNVGQPAPGK